MQLVLSCLLAFLKGKWARHTSLLTSAFVHSLVGPFEQNPLATNLEMHCRWIHSVIHEGNLYITHNGVD